ncbi:MAG: hypothetical protein HY069_01635 [Chlamydiia bacterium]|nr:hypothetical protein [Chlamydiia bacterium]
MKIKISAQMLSIPPYLSTSWKNILSLQADPNGQLVVSMYDGSRVEIPGLDQGSLDTIFEAHSRYADREVGVDVKKMLESPFSFQLPVSSDGTVLPATAHNPEQANLSPLPLEILQKIAAVTRALGLDDTTQIPQAEPNCNCMFCQVARVLHDEAPLQKASTEEIVDDADLHFRNWDIQQTAEKLYSVTNPLDTNEQYNVFLGEPLGCTCGEKHCEHLKAVLST